MTADTQRDDPVLLGAAEAILEAEWIRLTLDEDTWEREVAERSAEKPTRRPLAPPVGISTTVVGRSVAAPPRHADRWPTLDCPGRQVWATQRSPPSPHQAPHSKDAVEKWR
jgi:hypothetical protein